MMNSNKRLIQIPKSYYVENNFPCSKMDSIRIIRQNHKKKKDFHSDDEYKKYIVMEYYKKQVDDMIAVFDDNTELKIYILDRMRKLV